VRYLAGRAEQIPLTDASVDLALMFLSFHHVRDRAAAAREIARVLAPDGRLLIRSTFADRMPGIGWHRFFPRAREVELAMFPTTGDVAGAFAPAGLVPIALDTVQEVFAGSLAEHAERLQTRSISTFEHLTEPEIAEGFARLAEAVATEPSAPVIGDSDLMVLGRR
jgi:ubiquinone/menaquinone biosynthesis C-methylase UbiE